MSTRLSPWPTGQLRHRLRLEHPVHTPDATGGYTTSWQTIEPLMHGSVESATAGNVERLAAGTVVAGVTHIVRMRYHAGVSIDTRITVARPAGQTTVLSVVGIENVELRNVDLVLTCAELLP